MSRVLEVCKYQCLIGGRWQDAASREYFESFDPFTAKPWALIPRCDGRDVDMAVNAARQAFDNGPWRSMHPTQRGKLLVRLAELIARDADRLAALEVLDNGKLLTEMRAQV